eukprot:gene4908-955_t
MAVQVGLVDASWPDVAAFDDVNDKWARRVDPESGALVWNGIAVRVGIAYGEIKHEVNPVTRRVDYRGRPVNLASRCESSAPHGAVCISEELYNAVRADERLAGTEFLRLPKQDMKGIGEVSTFAATPGRLLGRVGFFRGFARNKQLSAPARRATVASKTSKLLSAASEASKRLSAASETSRRLSAASETSKRLSAARMPLLDLGLRTDEGSVAAIPRLAGAAADATGPAPAEVSALLNAALSRCVASALRTDGKLTALRGAAAHAAWNV